MAWAGHVCSDGGRQIGPLEATHHEPQIILVN
jgi:hypothetical protein